MTNQRLFFFHRPNTAILFLFLIMGPFYAQQKNDTSIVNVVQDKRIKDLIDRQIKANEKNNGRIEGYRVQIHFSNERSRARDVKAKFLMKYQNVGAYEKYEQPNFKIRVGDFRTRLEAYKFLKEISVDFPGSFIVQDEIELPKL